MAAGGGMLIDGSGLPGLRLVIAPGSGAAFCTDSTLAAAGSVRLGFGLLCVCGPGGPRAFSTPRRRRRRRPS